MNPNRSGGLRVLAVDDEPPALEDLLHLLRDDRRIARADGVTDATKALRYVHRTLDEDDGLDAVFLDLRMPGLNGLDLARVLARFSRPPAIVFVTAYSEHAVEAFELKAVDYLLKPVHTDRLADAIDRVISVCGKTTPSPAPQITEVVERSADPGDESVPVEVGGVTRFVRLGDIHYVEAQGDYARLHSASGAFLIKAAMATLEERWGSAGFVRVHRSYLVAARYIDELRLDAGQMTVLVGNQTLPVSRRHGREVRDRLVSRARPTTRRDATP